MDHRTVVHKRAARYAATWLSLVLVLPLSGCSEGGGPKAEESAPAKGGAAQGGGTKAIASMPMTLKNGPVRADLMALTRTAGNTVTARLKISNTGKNKISLSTALREEFNQRGIDSNLGDTLSASGIGLLDMAGGKMYMPLQQEGEYYDCVCSHYQGEVVQPGAAVDLYATFPSPPADVKKATVVVPLTFPFLSVPITGDRNQPLKGQIDPAKVDLKKPRILNVENFVQSLEKSVREDGNNRSVALSADVLFAVDKADLTPEADRLLGDLAKQIDASQDTAIEVDGHADDTGTDAINKPLSERRAKAVVNRLTSLVARKGITYEAAGHGSDDPVATNGTEEGRRQNRRVTITFAKPTKSAPSAVTGEPYKAGSSTVLSSGTFESARGLKVEVNSLHRDSSGLVVLVWTLRNTGKEAKEFALEFEWELYSHKDWPTQARLGTTGGVLLYDEAMQARYYPLNLDTGVCLCSKIRNSKPIAPGEAVVLYNAYKVPQDAGPLQMQLPWKGKLPDAVVNNLQIK